MSDLTIADAVRASSGHFPTARLPFEGLSHRRLLNLVGEVKRLAAGDLTLPALTAHFAGDIVNFLEVERCRVLVPGAGGWRVAADLGWAAADESAVGAHLSPEESRELEVTLATEMPRMMPCEAPAHVAMQHDEEKQGPLPPWARICVPVRLGRSTVAVIELGPYEPPLTLDEYSVGFLAALANVLADAVRLRLPAQAA